MVSDTSKKIGVVDYQLVCNYDQLIGSPIPFDFSSSEHPLNQMHSIQPDHVTTWHVAHMVEKMALTESAPNNHPQVKHEEVKPKQEVPRREMRVPESGHGGGQGGSGSTKDYETIKGLFVGLKNWHLLCRIIKLDYQEFTKKNSDKLVKLLNIELMDHSEVKIAGVFFYEAAEKFREELQVNGVYKISGGTIANEDYNNTKNEKMSPFRLIFNTNSTFEEVSDVNLIARPEEAALTLAQLVANNQLDQEFDVVGVLAAIEEPQEFNKGEKVLVKVNWVIADPTAQITIHAVLWNERIRV